jgi:hypothetical protein
MSCLGLIQHGVSGTDEITYKTWLCRDIATLQIITELVLLKNFWNHLQQSYKSFYTFLSWSLAVNFLAEQKKSLINKEYVVQCGITYTISLLQVFRLLQQ